MLSLGSYGTLTGTRLWFRAFLDMIVQHQSPSLPHELGIGQFDMGRAVHACLPAKGALIINPSGVHLAVRSERHTVHAPGRHLGHLCIIACLQQLLVPTAIALCLENTFDRMAAGREVSLQVRSQPI